MAVSSKTTVFNILSSVSQLFSFSINYSTDGELQEKFKLALKSVAGIGLPLTFINAATGQPNQLTDIKQITEVPSNTVLFKCGSLQETSDSGDFEVSDHRASVRSRSRRDRRRDRCRSRGHSRERSRDHSRGRSRSRNRSASKTRDPFSGSKYSRPDYKTPSFNNYRNLVSPITQRSIPFTSGYSDRNEERSSRNRRY